MQIFVSAQSALTLNVEPSDSIESVKAVIAARQVRQLSLQLAPFFVCRAKSCATPGLSRTLSLVLVSATHYVPLVRLSGCHSRLCTLLSASPPLASLPSCFIPSEASRGVSTPKRFPRNVLCLRDCCNAACLIVASFGFVHYSRQQCGWIGRKTIGTDRKAGCRGSRRRSSASSSAGRCSKTADLSRTTTCRARRPSSSRSLSAVATARSVRAPSSLAPIWRAVPYPVLAPACLCPN